MSLIEVKHVSKSFRVSKRNSGIPGMVANLLVPKYEQKTAVMDMSFSIEQGEMVGFIGQNGAGKSTTIKMLSGILYPDSGTICVNNYIPYKQRKEYVRHIGVVFGQKSQLQWDLPVIDSFELLKAIYGIPEDLYRKNLSCFTELLEMEEFLNRPVRQLSLGQRMRSDIAAALLHSPDIVFFDEPTIGVDIVGKEKIREFIRELNREQNVSMIFTTHDMQDIEKTCNRLLVIDKGQKVYDGSLEQMRRKYGTSRQIDIEFRDPVVLPHIEHVDMIEPEKGNARKKRLIFENTEIQIDRLMNQLLSEYPIRDISVSEPEIAQIVKKIYRQDGLQKEAEG